MVFRDSFHCVVSRLCGVFGLVSGVLVVLLAGCTPDAASIQIQEENRRLQIRAIELEELLAVRDARVADVERRMENLSAEGGGPLRQVFKLDGIEILDFTGGVNLDGEPGDDGVSVYFQPVDRDGDVLKRGGEIHVKLLDNSAIGSPRVLGEAVINDPEQIRRVWYGKFWTNHFKVTVPFHPNAGVAPGQEVDVYVSFLDRATGRDFTARTAVRVRGVLGE